MADVTVTNRRLTLAEIRAQQVIKPHMLCKACGVRKIARLQLIWCKECAA